MADGNLQKKSQLPFVMKPNLGAELMVLLGLGLGIFVVAFVINFLVNHPIDFHDFHAVGVQVIFALFVLIYFPLLFICLGKITCDEEGLKINVFGMPISRFAWKNVQKIKFAESADVTRSQPRIFIYHDGSFLGFPTWINNFMYRRDDLAAFLSLLHQKTAHVKFSGFSGK